MKPIGARHIRQRGAWQVSPYASKLTRRHRDAARADQAFATALREQTVYPHRIDALIAGQTWYGGKVCPKCGGIKRRVRDNSCWQCHTAGTGFVLDGRNRCVSLGSPTQTRDGYLDRLQRLRRERAGEYVGTTIGGWEVRQYPTGRLAVSCATAVVQGPSPEGRVLPALPPSPYLTAAPHGTSPDTLAFACADLKMAEPAFLYGLAERDPDFLSVLRWAGWAD